MSCKLKCFYQNTRGLRTKIAHGLKNRISNTDKHNMLTILSLDLRNHGSTVISTLKAYLIRTYLRCIDRTEPHERIRDQMVKLLMMMN